MPPTTISQPELSPRIEQLIENLIDELEGFGDEFADVVEELQGLLDRF